MLLIAEVMNRLEVVDRTGYGENNCFTEMCSGSEVGSYLRLIDFCSTQLWA